VFLSRQGILYQRFNIPSRPGISTKIKRGPAETKLLIQLWKKHYFNKYLRRNLTEIRNALKDLKPDVNEDQILEKIVSLRSY
jgi:hypothetical protein